MGKKCAKKERILNAIPELTKCPLWMVDELHVTSDDVASLVFLIVVSQHREL
jgi:hypothetical protein